MAGILRSVVQRPPGRLQTVTKGMESLICTDWIRHKFTRSRIPDKVFQPSPEDHEKYGGDPQYPHKLHIVTRIKSTKRRPYWEKDIIKMLGLEKDQAPEAATRSSDRGGHGQHVPQKQWGAGGAVASKPCQPGSEEVLTAEQLQSKKYKSFLFQDGEKVFSLKSVLKSFSLTKHGVILP
uniref:Large ribosomal subunit protein uL30m n=1 Tax=Sus scrofa TaxID=9823 RepID=A0A8D1WJ78_PIG